MTSHVLPPLPYDFKALQPWIDEQTLRLHYDYHRARVDALNAAEAQLAAQAGGADLAWMRYLQRVVAMRASEHVMHCLFWEIMGPNQSGTGGDAFTDQIRDDFGSLATFKSQFCAAALALEAEEWLALVWQPASARLAIRAVEYTQLPCDWAAAIVLVLDVGEHAYYLQYQNRRIEYAHNWWNTVNWRRVAERFAAATQPWPRAACSRSSQQPRSHSRPMELRVS
jgi:Fe-Mn family superoxide dismutase